MSVVANIAINVDSSGAVSKLRQVAASTEKLDATFKGLDGRLRDASGKFVKTGDDAQASSKKVNLLGNAIANLSSQLAVAEIARRYFQGFNEAEKAAAAVRTLGVDSKVLEQTLLGVSNSLGGLYSQTQLLAASYDVASAGFANAADNAKILEASAKGATGGLSDINTVGNAVTSVLNAYGKSANEAAILVDGFIQTQNDGKIVLNEYAGYIGRLAPTAAAAGVGIQELNAAVGTITAQGVPVEATFTGLNQALISILKPSAEAAELAKKLGIDFNEAGLRSKGFGGLLEEVKTKTGGSTTALVKLFGSVDALKAVLPLVNDDLVKYNQNLDRQAKVNGIADKATKELGGTVSSEVTKMINQIGNLARTLDTVLGPMLGTVVKGINLIIAQATVGIRTLADLFSMSKNTTILKGALESGNLKGASAQRALPGIDELIGEKRRKALQKQAGGGSGFLGLGLNMETFTKLLKQEPAIQKLLSPTAVSSKPKTAIDPTLQALLDSALNPTGGGTTGTGGTTNKKAKTDDTATKVAASTAELSTARQLYEIEGKLLEARQGSIEPLILARTAQKELLTINAEAAAIKADKELPAAIKKDKLDGLALKAAGVSRQLAFDINQHETERNKTVADILANYDTELIKKQAVTDVQKQTLELLEIENRLREQGIVLTDEERKVLRLKIAGINQVTKAQEAAIAQTQKEKELFDGIANTVVGSFSQAFDAAINGSKNLGEALKALTSDLLQMIGKMLIMYAIGAALKALAGGANDDKGGILTFLAKAFGHADGGPTSKGIPYVVGERGPELFVPSSNGGILSNENLRSAMGGNSGGGGGTTLNMSFQTSTINGVEYVSRDQLEAAMAQTRKDATRDGAKKGMSMTIDRLQQSPQTRSRVGMR